MARGEPRDRHARLRLGARPARPTRAAWPPGLHRLDLASGRDGAVYIPATLGPRPPLVIMFHGAGGDAQAAVAVVRAEADRRGFVLLAPESRAQTWDGLGGPRAQDAAFVDRALVQVFARYAIDPARIVLAGFSDGASFALTLGLANGDLCSGILAFSPGFAPADPPVGAPRIFLSHGVTDRVLPIDACTRVLVPRLRKAGLEVELREHAGGHTVPPPSVVAAFEWLWPAPGG